MTEVEFSNDFIKLYNHIWNVTFDKGKIDTWYKILSPLKIAGLLATVNSLATKENYPPSIKTIIDEYDRLKQRQDVATRERQIENQRLMIASAAAGQEQCPICEGKGFYLYFKEINNEQYETYCRCSCLRGKDLSRHSEYQTNKGRLWHNPLSGKNEDLYIPTVEDVFSTEELAIIKIKNTEKRQETKFDSNRVATISGLAEKFGMAR